MRFASLLRDRRGAAAAEMALVTPLLLRPSCSARSSSGNYFYNEHILVKAVRDGARYAARQDFANYDAAGAPTATVVYRDRPWSVTSDGTIAASQLSKPATSRHNGELQDARRDESHDQRHLSRNGGRSADRHGLGSGPIRR